MSLRIVHYNDPILRKKGARIDSITPEIKKLIADMFETMEKHRGVGLAAQQVGQSLQLTVIDVRAATDRPSTLHLNDQPADVNAFMKERGISHGPRCDPATNSNVDSRFTGSAGIQKLTFWRPSTL